MSPCRGQPKKISQDCKYSALYASVDIVQGPNRALFRFCCWICPWYLALWCMSRVTAQDSYFCEHPLWLPWYHRGTQKMDWICLKVSSIPCFLTSTCGPCHIHGESRVQSKHIVSFLPIIPSGWTSQSLLCYSLLCQMRKDIQYIQILSNIVVNMEYYGPVTKMSFWVMLWQWWQGPWERWPTASSWLDPWRLHFDIGESIKFEAP